MPIVFHFADPRMEGGKSTPGLHSRVHAATPHRGPEAGIASEQQSSFLPNLHLVRILRGGACSPGKVAVKGSLLPLLSARVSPKVTLRRGSCVKVNG